MSPIPTPEVAKAFTAEIRVKMMREFAKIERRDAMRLRDAYEPDAADAKREHFDGTLSPTELAEAMGDPLGNISYHVLVLVKCGMLELAKTEPRRGAVEHFYRRTETACEVMA